MGEPSLSCCQYWYTSVQLYWSLAPWTGLTSQTGAMSADSRLAHGEYKVAGGKLVVVDLDHDGREITEASVNGDFFLEPDEALADLNAGLRGLSVRATHQEIAAQIREGLRAEAQMIGFDEYAVASAVRRALGHASTWEDHTWEVLPPQKLPIAVNVALDQVLTEEVGRGNRPSLMRLWDWDERAVVIGSFQSLANEVDADAARRHEVQVVRRISGGGAMFMEPGNCVTYSLYFPLSGARTGGSVVFTEAATGRAGHHPEDEAVPVV